MRSAADDKIEAKMGAKTDDKFVKAPTGNSKALKAGGAVGLIPDNGDAKFVKVVIKAPAGKAMNKEMKSGGKVDERTMKKSEPKEKDEPKMKKGGDVKAHKYGKKAHHYAEGGSVTGFTCMPKMMSDMGKVNKERDE